MYTRTSDGTELALCDDADGAVPVVFQHGLGADCSQPFDLLGELHDTRRICVDCRLHGGTTTSSVRSGLGFKTFAADLYTVLDHLGIERCVAGGVSMGAGVALTFALRYPTAVQALVLCRPAWYIGPMSEELQSLFQMIATLLSTERRERAVARFVESEAYSKLAIESPDAAASMLKQFKAPRAKERAERLVAMPADSPISGVEALRKINVPVLVLATKNDILHPWEYAEHIAGEIQDSAIVALVSKAKNPSLHRHQARAAIAKFLEQRCR